MEVGGLGHGLGLEGSSAGHLGGGLGIVAWLWKPCPLGFVMQLWAQCWPEPLLAF